MTLVVDRLQDDGTGNSDAVQDIIDGRAKAWGVVDQTQAGHPLTDSFNISGTTDSGTGTTKMSFTNNMANNGYSISGSGQQGANPAYFQVGSNNTNTTSMQPFIRDENPTNRDTPRCSATANGTLA
jgi:hypothetical protein